MKIAGMHCDGCASTIKALLEQEGGVQMAAVSYEEGHARVLFDPQVIDVDRLAAVVERPGFRVVGRD